MPLASRKTLTATVLAIATVAAPVAQADQQRTAQGAPPILQTAPPSELHAAEHASAVRGGYVHVTRGGSFSVAELNAHAAEHRAGPLGSRDGGSTGNGFDYGDAAVGGGISVGIVLLLGAGGLTLRRRHQLQHQ
jgi:hypothetical protein